MSKPTDAARKMARAFVVDLIDAPTPEYRDDVERDLAAAFAAEREKAQAPFLALADQLSREAGAYETSDKFWTIRLADRIRRTAEAGQ